MAKEPAVKGATLGEFSSHATVLDVDLSVWGAAAGSRIKMLRCSGVEIQIMGAQLKEHGTPPTMQALVDLTDHLARFGFERAWATVGLPNPKIEKAMVDSGFLPAGSYWRSELDLKKEKLEADPAISTQPMEITDSEFRTYFEESLSGAPHLQWNSNPSTAASFFLHERLVPQYRDYFKTVLLNGKVVGCAGLVAIPVFGKNIASLCPFLSKQIWDKRDLAAKVIRGIAADLQQRDFASVGAGVEESEMERAAFYEGIGFTKTTQYFHFVRDLRLSRT